MPEPESLDEDLAVLDQLRPRPIRFRIGVGAGIVLLLAALVVSVTVSMLAPRGSTEKVGATVDAESDSESVPRVSRTASAAGVIFVHVLGAVHNPGLYELASGSRAIDAVSAAGGFTTDAEPSAVNLARVLADGEQFSVLRVGEEPGPDHSAVGSAVGGSGIRSSHLVSINSASAAELTTLPQVGPATAQRIIDWRTANGPFLSVTDLMSVTGIGQKTFDGLKDLITV